MVELTADANLLPWLLALGAALFALLCEWLHAHRVRRVARLLFGPTGRPAWFARLAPIGRVLALCAVTWGLATLLLIAPKKHAPEGTRTERGDFKHILLVLDVSPSMRLTDAGPDKQQSRMQRTRAVLNSFFGRVPIDEYRISVVAVYNGAKAVVIDTRDLDVVENILGDLPMHFAFPAGKTRLFDGLEAAAEVARPWAPWSTTLILVSDGDTVPATGMPRLPPSIAATLVVGVGDPVTGKFIDGRQSRQDISTLRQMAARLGGAFHNANDKHLSSALIADLTQLGEGAPLLRLSRREYALLACGAGAGLLAFLPLLLHAFGTRWQPGVRRRSAAAPSARNRRAALPLEAPR